MPDIDEFTDVVVPGGMARTRVRTDKPWPPPVITKWLQGGGVSPEALAAELRNWADWFDAARP